MHLHVHGLNLYSAHVCCALGLSDDCSVVRKKKQELPTCKPVTYSFKLQALFHTLSHVHVREKQTSTSMTGFELATRDFKSTALTTRPNPQQYSAFTLHLLSIQICKHW